MYVHSYVIVILLLHEAFHECNLDTYTYITCIYTNQCFFDNFWFYSLTYQSFFCIIYSWLLYYPYIHMYYRQERRRYYRNRQMAVENPNEYLSMIVDGMDQNKTNIPSLVRILVYYVYYKTSTREDFSSLAKFCLYT